VRILDLAAIGPGDPTMLTAATLDRDVYPRLLATMDDAPPAQSGQAPDDPDSAPIAWSVHSSSQAQETSRPVAAHPPCSDADGPDGATTPATKSLLREWQVALDNADLAGCRAVYAAMIDVAGSDAVAPLAAQIEALADRVERTLREAFAAHVRRCDFDAAIAMGERMCNLLPDRRVCGEFRRLLPHLRRHADAAHDSARAAVGAHL
jgi:hypothetical protein